MYDEAKEFTEQEARAQGIPPGVALSWTRDGRGNYILSTTHAGNTEPLCQFTELEMQDLPGGYADRTGDDLQWPRARTRIREAVIAWKRNRGR